MRFDIITIFPKIFDSYLKESLIKRAQKKGVIKIVPHDLRKFVVNKHKKAKPRTNQSSWFSARVDDRPFGGGPGMVLKIEPIWRAVQFAKRKAQIVNRKRKVILFSTRGKKLDSKTAKRLALCDQLVLICGRYEGVDERVAKYVADEEISIGDYVLSGGELPALVLIETVSRFLKGFLGKHESLEEIKGSYPTYTRPENFSAKGRSASGGKIKQWKVPKVLLSGDHKKIEAWRTR